jgi:hypothetical protein
MTRPLYETDRDRAKELELIKEIELKRKVRFLKLPITFKVDGLITYKQRPFAWAEIKNRNLTMGDYPTVILSLKKLKAGLFLQQHLQGEKGQLELLFFVGALDGLYYTKLKHYDQYEVQIGGRYKDKRDEYDVERVVHIPIVDFQKV